MRGGCRSTGWYFLPLLCYVTELSFVTAALPQQDPSVEIVTAYEKAGADYLRYSYQSGFYSIVWAPAKPGQQGWPCFSFWSKPVNDDFMGKLPALDMPCCLALSRTNVGVSGLPWLSRFPRLKVLDLSISSVDDRGLKEIGKLEQLEFLYLDSTAVTDEGLKHLAGLRQLRVLSLSGTQVEGTGLRALGGFAAVVHAHVESHRAAR